MADKYISAEALTLSLRDDPNLNAASFARVKRHIEAAPDMVKRGRWLYDSGSNKYFCPVCDGYALSFRKDTLYVGELYEVCLTDFCPNCGAEMRGVEDGR